MKMKFFKSNKFKITLVLAFAFAAAIFFTTPLTINAAGKKKVDPIIDPKNPNSVLYTDADGNVAGMGGTPDKPASKALQAGSSVAADALKAENLPKDKYGLIDWAELVRKGMIDPKGNIEGTPDMDPMDLNVRINSKSKFVNDVKYPHFMHTYWLSCEICHDTVGGAIFQMAAGTNGITMVGISQGKWCGRCHGKVAFPLADCNRCHSVKKGEEMPMMENM